MTHSVESRISYIIGYRQSSADRLTGLKFVLNWLNAILPDMEIILVEQDEKPKLDIPLPANCKKYFIYNPGLYNRCWAFNVGVKKTEKEILVFADSDMFMSREDYLRCFEVGLAYEAVNPNGNRVINVGDADSERLTFEELENRKLWTFAAGIMLMQRQALEKIGGWDERFEGWGVEDDAITHLIRNMLSNITLNCRMYHVDHARSNFDGSTQPNYLLNKKNFEEISTLYGASLARYINLPKAVTGDELKYSSKENKEEKFPRLVYFIMTEEDPVLFRHNLEGWEQTRTKDAVWTLLVSDSGLSSEVTGYLKKFKPENASVIRLDHNGQGHIRRFNDALRKISEMEFDLGFYADPRISFKKAGWDLGYYRVIKRTGLSHLCFFDEKISSVKPYTEPIVKGDLICRAGATDVQSDFFTLTPEIIREVGFLDNHIMGKARLEFLDFSLRCFRKGFNVINNPFDLRNSREFLVTGNPLNVIGQSRYVQLTEKSEGLNKKRWLQIQQPRGFIPDNDLIAFDVSEKKWMVSLLERDADDVDLQDSKPVDIRKPLSLGSDEITWITAKREYVKAEGRIKWNKGLAEILVGLIRNIYNLFFILRLKFAIRIMDRFSNFLIRAGVAFKKIDSK
jgi:hypothetical protein